MSEATDGGAWLTFLDLLTHYRIGDLASIAGVLISLVGFGVTVVGVLKSQRAAAGAERAARETRDSIRLLDTIVDFAAAISTLEEIKRLHREAAWPILPDRYAALRKLLISTECPSLR